MPTGSATPQRRKPDSTSPIIYLVDDDASFLRALSRRLRAAGLRVVAFENAGDFLDHVRPEGPACVVLDLEMPESGGLELQEKLAESGATLPVIFLTGHGDVASSVRAMKDGAIDYLTKPVSGDDLLDAVGRALTRGRAMREQEEVRNQWQSRYATLTPAERRVFALIVKGLPNKGIAGETGTCERTVKAHRAEVMRKMRVQAPAELGRGVEWLAGVFETA